MNQIERAEREIKRIQKSRTLPDGQKRSESLRVKERAGVTFLTVPAFENTGLVRHLISTRLGGVSQGYLGTMNLSYARGDLPERVDENYRRLAAVLDCDMADFVCSDQTHTDHVRQVTGKDRGKGVVLPKDYRDVDGLITDEPGVVLVTFFADCVPLLFLDPVRKAVGLAHSGWRGSAKRMGEKTIKAMGEAFGSRPEDILAAVGPSICQDCYEVSQDVAQVFWDMFVPARERPLPPEVAGADLKERLAASKPDGKYQLDLWMANYIILRQAGILPEHITVTDICTCCNPWLLYSHRASQGLRGNFGAFLGLL